jgi:glycosyltransferase involved in cell wall biosynthesis
MFNPRVSVGLIVYNGEQFLQETMDSLLAQTYSDFELIISDNASTDRTWEIAQACAAKDERIRLNRNETNLGVSGNHNHVFRLARGEYFKWAAADDVCRPNYLARCVEVLDRDPTVVLAYPKTQFIDQAGRPLDIEDPGWDLRSDEAAERMRYVIFAGHWVNAVVGLIRSSALAKTRLMPAYPGGDYRILGELSLLGKFYEIPEVLFERRLHPGASSEHGAGGTNPDLKWLIHCWTGKEGRVSLPHWGLKIDHLRTIMRSQLALRQKISLTRLLLQHVRWQRSQLARELWTAITAILLPAAPTLRERG